MARMATNNHQGGNDQGELQDGIVYHLGARQTAQWRQAHPEEDRPLDLDGTELDFKA